MPLLARDGVATRLAEGLIRARPTHLDARKARHHDVWVRTTLTLDPDVARMLQEEAHRLRKPFKDVVNDAIRRGLAPQRRAATAPYRVKVHSTKLRPGVDRAGFNKLADELEDEGVMKKAGRRGR